MEDDQHRRDKSDPNDLIAALGELIDALDRRIPHVERVGELRIAGEAAALRKEALARIEELKHASERAMREAGLANAVMNDDGGPASERTDKPHGL